MPPSADTLPPPASNTPQWEPGNLANPHAVADKAQRVNRMFSAIARSYDLNNHLHSLWIDQHWRSVAVKTAAVKPTDIVADVACGTGDLSLAFAKARPARVIGLDFCHPMLQGATHKTQRCSSDRPVGFYEGDALRLPLRDKSVDVVSIAFGIRNVADWGRAIDEFYRVLRPGGRLIILEFSLPRNAVLRAMYNFYFWKVIPFSATLISGDKTGAYRYLPRSVDTFISPNQMQARMEQAGFKDISAAALTFGICYCYRGVLPHD